MGLSSTAPIERYDLNSFSISSFIVLDATVFSARGDVPVPLRSRSLARIGCEESLLPRPTGVTPSPTDVSPRPVRDATSNAGVLQDVLTDTVRVEGRYTSARGSSGDHRSSGRSSRSADISVPIKSNRAELGSWTEVSRSPTPYPVPRSVSVLSRPDSPRV